ncbi:hypothetical protein IMAU10142_01690 [Lactobacillus helveticus]|nr:hypothetical protein [Lactobacillus helveticus]NRO85080.1 hypothetical protein [Lactobacillus helveticus]NRO91660.1 hypothetical protein [Lactobacillus helveticus]
MAGLKIIPCQPLPAYGRHSDNLETTVIQLYTKGITTAEIAELIEKCTVLTTPKPRFPT